MIFFTKNPNLKKGKKIGGGGGGGGKLILFLQRIQIYIFFFGGLGDGRGSVATRG